MIEADESLPLSAETLARVFDVERMVAHRRRFLDALGEGS